MTPKTPKEDGNGKSSTYRLWAMTASTIFALPPFQKERGRLSSDAVLMNWIELSQNSPRHFMTTQNWGHFQVTVASTLKVSDGGNILTLSI